MCSSQCLLLLLADMVIISVYVCMYTSPELWRWTCPIPPCTLRPEYSAAAIAALLVVSFPSHYSVDDSFIADFTSFMLWCKQTGVDNSFDNLKLSAQPCWSHCSVLGYSYKLMAVSSVEAEQVTVVGHVDLKVSMLSPVVDVFKAQWLRALSLHREF